MSASLLHYRGWQGQFRGPMASVWPIARVALATLLRRRMFWVLYAFSLLLFLMFFFGSFLLDWIESQMPSNIQVGAFRPEPEVLIRAIRNALRVLNGSRDTFAYFFIFQATMVVVTLALAGAVMVGSDFTERSLPFYLAKPISRRHYLLGKGLAVGVVVNLLTTLPALVLFAQHGMDDWHYFTDVNYFHPDGGPGSWQLLLGILSYGLILTTFLSLFLVTMVTLVRRTVPLVMLWVSTFLFLRIMSGLLVGVLKWDGRWRLLDLWNDMSLLGRACLGYDHSQLALKPQPAYLDAGLTLAGVSLLCLIFLNLRIRAVDIIR
jgi:ABC-2 type transport system permease protein